MKHSEFKRRIEDLGFEVIDWDEYLITTNENGDVGSVSKEYEAVMNNFYSIPLSPEVRASLLEIMFEYARTPIEDREDEKRYSIYPLKRKVKTLVRFDNTFRDYGYEHDRSFDIFAYVSFEKGLTSVFPESEAKEICDYFGWDFSKVAEEVKDEG